MSLRRIDAGSRMSEAVIYQKTIYYTSVPEDLTGDAYAQTADALAVIDKVLASLQSDKTKIIDATIILPNKQDFDAMNRAWDAWVVPGAAPVRCTIEAGLMHPDYKIEIKIIAAQ